MKYFTDRYLQDVLRSSLFLGVNGGGLAANICLLRFVANVHLHNLRENIYGAAEGMKYCLT